MKTKSSRYGTVRTATSVLSNQEGRARSTSIEDHEVDCCTLVMAKLLLDEDDMRLLELTEFHQLSLNYAD